MDSRMMGENRNRNLEKLFNSLNNQTCSYNNVRFESFRIALKVRALMAKFKLTYVDYKIALFQLNQEGIAFGHQFPISIDRVKSIIRAIYQSLPAMHFSDVSIGDLTDALCAVISRILGDSQTKQQFDSESFKLTFFALLNMNITLKYMYLYQMSCFPSSTLPIKKARLLFLILSKISHCMECSQDDADSTAECLLDGLLSKANHKDIDKNVYLEFLGERPQSLEWIHSLHVLLAANTVRHEAQCDVCHTYPIIGLRYRCLHCFDYDLCSNCHFAGSFSKDHIPAHETEQLAKQVKPFDDFKALIEILRKKLLRKKAVADNSRALTLYTKERSLSNINTSCDSASKLMSNSSSSQTMKRVYRPLSPLNKTMRSMSSTINGHRSPPPPSTIINALVEMDELETDPPCNIGCDYDNVPSFQEFVRSVEMETSYYDRYINVSKTVYTAAASNVPACRISGSPSSSSAWHRAVSRWQRVNGHSTDEHVVYQNVNQVTRISTTEHTSNCSMLQPDHPCPSLTWTSNDNHHKTGRSLPHKIAPPPWGSWLDKHGNHSAL